MTVVCLQFTVSTWTELSFRLKTNFKNHCIWTTSDVVKTTSASPKAWIHVRGWTSFLHYWYYKHHTMKCTVWMYGSSASTVPRMRSLDKWYAGRFCVCSEQINNNASINSFRCQSNVLASVFVSFHLYKTLQSTQLSLETCTCIDKNIKHFKRSNNSFKIKKYFHWQVLSTGNKTRMLWKICKTVKKASH